MATKNRSTSPDWIVVFKQAGKVKVVRMPGGLHEPEAQRGAALKVGRYAQFVRSYREDPQQKLAAAERTLDLCLRAV